MFSPDWNPLYEEAGHDTVSQYNFIYIKSDNTVLRKQDRYTGIVTEMKYCNIDKLHNMAFALEELTKKLNILIK